MIPRLPSLLERPMAFGVVASAPSDDDPPPSGLDELTALLGRGAPSVSADAWVTADGVAVVDRSGRVGGRWRRKRLDQVRVDDLPPSSTRLDELYRAVGPDRPLSLDVRDPAAFEAIVATARDAGDDTETTLWLCHRDLAVLTPWRSRTSARLVNVADYRGLPGGLERRAAELEQRDLDALRLDHKDWTGGRVTLLHRFGRLALASGPVHDREVATLFDAGVDGVYSASIEHLVGLLAEFYDRS